MPRYRVFVKETRYEDWYVTADSADDARARYEHSREVPSLEEADAIERGFYDEVTDWEVEEVIEE